MATKNVEMKCFTAEQEANALAGLKDVYVAMNEAFASKNRDEIANVRDFLVERLRKVTSLLSVSFDRQLEQSNVSGVDPIRKPREGKKENKTPDIFAVR